MKEYDVLDQMFENDEACDYCAFNSKCNHSTLFSKCVTENIYDQIDVKSYCMNKGIVLEQ